MIADCSGCPTLPTLLISIDLPSSPVTRSCAVPTLRALLEVTQRTHLPITWAFPELEDEVLAQLREQRPSHEVALECDTWQKAGLGRRQIAQQLIRALSAAARNQLSLTTLVLQRCAGWGDMRDLQLLAATGITLLRARTDRAPRYLRPARTARLRHGLAAIHPSGVVPPAWWPAWNTARQLRHLTRQRQGGPTTLLVSLVLTEASASPREVGPLTRFLEAVARQRDAGVLRVMTLREHALERLPHSRGTGSRSILRAA